MSVRWPRGFGCAPSDRGDDIGAYPRIELQSVVTHVALHRTVRICVNNASGDGADRAANSYAGAPAMIGAARYYEFTMGCAGEADPATGYLLSIKEIDDALRSPAFMQALREACDSGREPAASVPGLARVAEEMLRQGAEGLAGAGEGARIDVRSFRWQLTPFYSVEAIMAYGQTRRVHLRQRFDFAASHRLHTAKLSDDENRRVFGKCNNPRGHGHNYKVEVCVEVASGTVAHNGAAGHLTLAEVERVVDAHVIQRFDHKHLNEDTQEFDESRGGVMPSVENIAAVCYRLLEGPLGGKPSGAASAAEAPRLVSVTVWETEKTSATYPA